MRTSYQKKLWTRSEKKKKIPLSLFFSLSNLQPRELIQISVFIAFFAIFKLKKNAKQLTFHVLVPYLEPCILGFTTNIAY